MMMIKKTGSFAALLFLFSLFCFSQDQRVLDSLKQELAKKNNADTTRVDILNQIARQYIGNSPSDAFDYLDQAWALAVEKGYKKGIAVTLYNKGYNYFRQSDYINALTTLEKSAKAFDEIGNLRGLAASYNNIGNVFYEIGYYKIALEFQLKALEIQEKIKTQNSIAISLNNIGNIYSDLKEYEKAWNYYDSALKIHIELDDSLSMALCYNNFGVICKNKHDTAKALEYYLKSVSIKEQVGSIQGLSITLGNIGFLYLYKKMYNSALEYFSKSLKFAEESQSPDDRKNAYKGIADANEGLGRFQDAYKYYKQYSECKDSLFNIETEKEISSIQNKFEIEKYENDISLQKSEIEKQDIRIEKQQFQLFGLITGVILLLSLSIAVYTGYKRKKKDNIVISSEKKRSDDLLLNILPAEIARELKQYGKSHAKKYEMVTVMFADFENFTSFAEKLKPEEVLDELDFCFREFDSIISKYNIEKIKTIGDSYMCAGGVPVPNKTNPIDVVKCGLDMRDFIEKHKRDKIQDNELYLDVRIGIHSGPLVAGVVGVKKFAYDIWGDTVNIASRMESASQVGKVNVSGEVYKNVKDNFACEYRGKIEAKNKGEIDMYFIERL
jgi:adenylate cyclase